MGPATKADPVLTRVVVVLLLLWLGWEGSTAYWRVEHLHRVAETARSVALVHFLPNQQTTPGAINPKVTQANIQSTICRDHWTTTVRPPTSYTEPIKLKQLSSPAYGDKNPHHYELDHRVPLEVGGSPRSRKNLWVEPRFGPWNARMKDRLENRVHLEVCSGLLTLKEGQAVFRGDWTAAYQATFGS